MNVVGFEECIIFGCQMHIEISDVLDFCLSRAKYYIACINII